MVTSKRWWLPTILICCIICITTAGAAVPDLISVTSDSDQIRAGGAGASITVEPDQSLPEIASVTFSYMNTTADPSGTLSVITDTIAPYETLYTSDKAGTAYIQAVVTFTGTSAEPLSTIFTQDVIPDSPYRYEDIMYQSVEAGSADNITVRMLDRYGNSITADTGDTITFSVSGEGTGFSDDGQTVQTNTVPFDTEGNCITRFLAPERAGPVIVSVNPGEEYHMQYLIVIDVVGESSPAQMTPYIVTVPTNTEQNRCPADGVSYFRINYVVRDQYGNTIGNYPVNVSTSLGEATRTISNGNGVATFIYGPKTGIGNVTVTAQAGTVTATSELSFTGGSGTHLSVTINPNNIPSRDVFPDGLVAVQARVYNDFGTGTPGEEMQAWITAGSLNATNTMKDYPGLSTNNETGFENGTKTAITGKDGVATFYFRPGAFPVSGEGDFDPFCRGSATVTTMWNGQTATSPEITWRNYPYLRVETKVSNGAIAPGDPLDVTIQLIGDGNELLVHDPVDVVFCLDRGEDMLKDEGAEDRMEQARGAAMSLVEGEEGENILTPGRDRVALISYSDKSTDPEIFPTGAVDLHYINDNLKTFNWVKLVGDDSNSLDYQEENEYVLGTHYPGNGITAYSDYATIDEPFAAGTIPDWAGVESALRDTVPFKADKTGEASSPLRYGLKKSIEYLADNDNSGAIQAVVVLMQNYYRYYGDPFAEGSVMTALPDAKTLPKGGSDYYYFSDLPADQQNMVDYALTNDVKIYAIYYPSSGSQSDEAVPRRLAEDTGGDYYFAGNEAELTEAFSDIRDSILRDAGTRTNVNLNFVDTPEDVSYTADEVLTYLPSTDVNFYNWSADPYTPTDHLAGYPYTEDQSAMWLGEDGSRPASLSFAVGNISIKQTWTTEITLKVNDSIDSMMNFSLFADGSYVQFENQDGETIMEPFPKTMITVIPGLAPGVLLNASLGITSFSIPNQDTEYAHFAWEIAYNGVYPLTQELAIKSTDDIAQTWYTVSSERVPPDTTSGACTVYIGGIPRGNYSARLKVISEDAGYDTATLPFTIGTEQYYIRLE